MKPGRTLPAWLGNWALPVALFLLALVPRFLGRVPLNNTDELLWIDRTLSFWTALRQGDWAGTFVSYHPGVVPTWGFGSFLVARFGLSQLASWRAAGALPILDLARTAALFPVLLTSLTVALTYRWLARLAGPLVALLAALLLALEPYFLAHSTFIHLDATVTSLMFLAALAWLVYLLADGGAGFLILAGVLSGLAILTKTQAIYLLPYTLLAAGVTYLARVGKLWTPRSWHEIARLAAAWGSCWAVAAATMLALWPVLWVDAAHAVQTVVGRAMGHVLEPHQLPIYFLGERTVADPGMLYYLLALVFRLRPLTLILAPAALGVLALGWSRFPLRARQRACLVLGLAYPLFFFAEMSLGSQKMERYLLPMFPALAALAGVVLAAGITRLHRGRVAPGWVVILVVAVILLSLPWLVLAPHYTAYFNPLAGGGSRAADLFIVGGGEGLDLAAAYLNDKPAAQDLWVLSYYPQVFMHYFEGSTQSPRYGSWGGLPVAADYMVVTSAQAQRGIYPSTLDFFLPRRPEHTVRINGIEYAWVYPVPRLALSSPPPIQYPMDANFEHRVHLIGYDLLQEPGLRLTLYWQLIVSISEQLHVRIRLVDESGAVVVEQSDPPWSGDVAVLSWPDGLAVRDQHIISLPESSLAPLGTSPAGSYRLILSLEQRDEEGQVRLLKLEGGGRTELDLGPVPLP